MTAKDLVDLGRLFFFVRIQDEDARVWAWRSERVCAVLDSETHSMLAGSDNLYMDPVPLFLPWSTLLI